MYVHSQPTSHIDSKWTVTPAVQHGNIHPICAVKEKS